MPDPIFSDLYRETEQLSWAPIEQVRRRGRQRVRRARVTAGLAAVLAVVAVGTGVRALVGDPQGMVPPVPPAKVSPSPTPVPTPSPSAEPTPSPSPSPSGTPSRTPDPTGTPIAPGAGSGSSPAAPRSGTPRSSTSATGAPADPSVPSAAMLQAADLPAGWRFAGEDTDGDWTFEFSASGCAQQVPWVGSSVGRRDRELRGPDLGPERTQGALQQVQRYSVTDARAVMSRVRNQVARCGAERTKMSVVDQGFVGDDALIVRAESIETGKFVFHIFVRQGDLVAEVWKSDAKDVAAARSLARKAATRLCAGTDAC
ncbi:hypothetical protein K7640_17690 [Micromonospora sp. PLK6-60]|uniref:hypothetical protein n=1 Tax=Micromonospora sp. PLK6-60 TaxID=2873383 RepID=UPI001CA6A9CE|nr:hypothetical protein [Micromonospora sp. PLK6-60]MBY8873668.1 hypothetical protein [Micromonospora sp. PLK6-60]